MFLFGRAGPFFGKTRSAQHLGQVLDPGMQDPSILDPKSTEDPAQKTGLLLVNLSFWILRFPDL